MNVLDRAKYRGKLTEGGHWVEGFLSHFEGVVTITMNRVIGADIGQPENIQMEGDVDPETVGQFTGLKDKNGIDVFEGMKIRNLSGRICVVEWNEYQGCWDCTPTGDTRNTDSVGFKCIDWDRLVEVVK